MKLSLLFLAIIPFLGGCASCRSVKLKPLAASSAQSDILIFSIEETAAISKWKNKSMDVLSADAFKGDPAALWHLGMSFVTGGGGWFVDSVIAKFYMSLSASLGFAPAIDSIGRMYLDHEDPFLFTVYRNLAIAFGHHELVNSYHDLLSKIPAVMVQEIEKIALHKHARILKYINMQKKYPDCCVAIPITDEDVLFTLDYWQKVLNGDAPKNIDEWIYRRENFEQIVEHSKIDNEHRKSQLNVFANAAKAV